MRAISKVAYGKGGRITTHKVLKVVTDCGEFDANEMYFYDCDVNSEDLVWNARRYEIAKDILANLCIERSIPNRRTYAKVMVKEAVELADLLIEELR